MNINEECPFVSVIVPVGNGEKTIEKLINALLGQDYPADRREIIIVDNDSNDRTVEIVKKYPVILEQENRVRSSYAARNKGLSLAKGEIIAFTDADCIPERDWLSSGVQALLQGNADMAGGEVSFLLSTSPSSAEIIDSVTFMQNEQYIEKMRGAVTANLFVRSHLFNQIGFFPQVSSGGDIQWTGKALKDGFSLIFVPQAVVLHPLRNFEDLIEKFWRVGTGIGWGGTKHKRNELIEILCLMLRLLVPLPQKNIRTALMQKEINKEIKKKRLVVWIISYVCQLSLFGGIISSVFKKCK